MYVTIEEMESWNSEHILIRFEILINSIESLSKTLELNNVFGRELPKRLTQSTPNYEMWNIKDWSIVCDFYISKPEKHTQHSEHSESNTWYYLLLCNWSIHDVLSAKLPGNNSTLKPPDAAKNNKGQGFSVSISQICHNLVHHIKCMKRPRGGH